jgi:hypothetical protein
MYLLDAGFLESVVWEEIFFMRRINRYALRVARDVLGEHS